MRFSVVRVFYGYLMISKHDQLCLLDSSVHTAPASQGTCGRIPFKPEIFQAFSYATTLIVTYTAAIIFHVLKVSLLLLFQQ